MVFKNGTGMIEVPPTDCGNQVTKHDCISCCIQKDLCNIVYIAYQQNSNQVDWFMLYYKDKVELISATSLAAVPAFWVHVWSQTGGQPLKSQLVVFGKNEWFPFY